MKAFIIRWNRKAFENLYEGKGLKIVFEKLKLGVEAYVDVSSGR